MMILPEEYEQIKDGTSLKIAIQADIIDQEKDVNELWIKKMVHMTLLKRGKKSV